MPINFFLLSPAFCLLTPSLIQPLPILLAENGQVRETANRRRFEMIGSFVSFDTISIVPRNGIKRIIRPLMREKENSRCYERNVRIDRKKRYVRIFRQTLTNWYDTKKIGDTIDIIATLCGFRKIVKTRIANTIVVF